MTAALTVYRLDLNRADHVYLALWRAGFSWREVGPHIDQAIAAARSLAGRG